MKLNILFLITFALFSNVCVFAQEEPESLCGSDDRVPSTDLAVGRIIHTAYTNLASTGFIIANGKIVTAGHVFNLIQQGDWLEFNVKPRCRMAIYSILNQRTSIQLI